MRYSRYSTLAQSVQAFCSLVQEDGQEDAQEVGPRGGTRDRRAEVGHSLTGILKLKTFLAGHNSFEHVLHAARYFTTTHADADIDADANVDAALMVSLFNFPVQPRNQVQLGQGQHLRSLFNSLSRAS